MTISGKNENTTREQFMELLKIPSFVTILELIKYGRDSINDNKLNIESYSTSTRQDSCSWQVEF